MPRALNKYGEQIPNPGASCECYQCGHVGRLSDRIHDVKAAFFLSAQDFAVICGPCFRVAWDSKPGVLCVFDDVGGA